MSEVLIECQDYRMRELDLQAADRMLEFKPVNCVIECSLDDLNVFSPFISLTLYQNYILRFEYQDVILRIKYQVTKMERAGCSELIICPLIKC